MVNKLRKNLTERQKKVLNALREFILENGYSPTIRQLGETLSIANPPLGGPCPGWPAQRSV